MELILSQIEHSGSVAEARNSDRHNFMESGKIIRQRAWVGLAAEMLETHSSDGTVAARSTRSIEDETKGIGSSCKW